MMFQWIDWDEIVAANHLVYLRLHFKIYIYISVPDCIFMCFDRVSLLVLKDSSSAYLATVLFCFNPASIFYSSV